MTTLRDIRKRLHSVQNIQQLTKAMEMIAASHLHYAQFKVHHAQRYFSELQQILKKLDFKSIEFTPPLIKQREGKKMGVVVIAGKMGLCGSYNQDIFRTTNKFLNSLKENQVELFVVGRKTIDYYKHRAWPIRSTFAPTDERENSAEVKAFANQLVHSYLNGDFDEIWVVYTHYINLMSRKVVIEKLLSIDVSSFEKEKDQSLDYLFEPNPEEIYHTLLLDYCLAKFQLFFNEAYVSELSARIFAMKTATNNANEMIEKLTIIRNRVRQAGITKEMLEISSGAESLK